MSSEEIPPDDRPKKGKFVVDNDGVFKIKADGGLAVFNSEGECQECCECVPYTLAGRREGDPAVLVASNEKARKVLHWTPVYSELADMLADAWAWEMNRRY